MIKKKYKIRRSGVSRRRGLDRRKLKIPVRNDRRVGERRILLRRLEDILRTK